jgi:hypothetical protein
VLKTGTKMEKLLKAQYQWKLWVFIIANFSILVSIHLTSKIDINTISTVFNEFKVERGITLVLLPIITLILNGLVSSNLKSILVFWRLKNPLPGCRVFTEIALSDPRIEINVLEQKFGHLPDEPVKQNQLWYKIYKKHQEKKIILDSHINYLLSRDMASLGFLFLILYPIYLVISGLNNQSFLLFGIILISEYIILAITAQNYGKRFICNVLTEESSSD